MNHYYTDNKSLPSNQKSFTYYFDNKEFTFTTDNGVFSKERVDYGSDLLIRNVYKRDLGNNILDLGCGYGPVGIIVKAFNPDTDVHAVDVNSRAVELTKLNSKINKTDINAIVCEDITTLGITFDTIILNPPIRAGKKIIYDLYDKSHECLKSGGSLYIVIQKKQGADSSYKQLKSIFKEVTILDRSAGYHIYQAIK